MQGEQPQDAPTTAGPEEKGAEAEGTPRLRLRSLKVHQFRDVRPGTELAFGDGFHLILGKNATGKSTLLELLAAVSVLDFRGPFFAETPFHIEASLEVGKVSLQVEVRRTFERQRIASGEEGYLDLPPHEDAEVIVRLEHPGVPLIQWMRARSDGGIRVFTADPRRSEESGIPFGLSGSDVLDFSLSMALSLASVVIFNKRAETHPAIRDTYHRLSDCPGTGAPFDESLGVLESMVGDDLGVVRGDGYSASSSWLPPALNFNARGEPVTRDLFEDPLLKGAVERLGYDGAKVYFGPGKSISIGWSYSSPSFQFFRHGKAVRRHDQLSFGQKRLFSFAWYLACNPDVAIADELVNGLHLEWIDWCVEALGDRQCFLTSQNPLLVDAMPFASEEDVRRGIIVCSSAPDATGEGTELSWRQLDEREASILGGALQQSRLDLLSDLLRALDLW